jgi:hypothetical protein
MPQLMFDLAIPMNEAEFIALGSGSFKFRTHPGTGGHSGYIPIRLDRGEQGSAEFDIDVDVATGSVGIAAVDAAMAIVSERQSSRRGGAQKLQLRIPDLRSVAGVLLRNADHRGLASEGVLRKINICPFVGPIFAVPRTTLSGVLKLPLRRREGPVGGSEQCPKSGGGHQTSLKEVSISETAVVVVDPWASHECPGWEERMAENVLRFLLPALKAFRSVGIPIIYAPHDRAMHPAILPAESELVMNGVLNSHFVADGFRAAGIMHLIYMGYASNYCLMTRPIGMMDMWREGLSIIVVRDASIALETSETLDGKWSHRVMMDFVEANLGVTVSVDEICRACNEVSFAQIGHAVGP